MKQTQRWKVSLDKKPLHLAIGMFDGLHLGHQGVVQTAIQNAQEGIAGVLTFTPHPKNVLFEGKPTQLIFPESVKFEQMKELGVELLIQKKFTKGFSLLSPENFLKALKRNLRSLHSIYVGSDFHFGHDRTGNVAYMVELGKSFGIQVYSLPAMQVDGHRISSSRIRQYLARGEIEEANSMLGYEYFHKTHLKNEGKDLYTYPWPCEVKLRSGEYQVTILGDKPVGGLAVVKKTGPVELYCDHALNGKTHRLSFNKKIG